MAASAILTVGVVLWWQPGGDQDWVVDPQLPAGTYEATLTGDVAGTWRLRFEDGVLDLVAPDTQVLGTPEVEAPYQIDAESLTTDVLADELADEGCTRPGEYAWENDGGLQLTPLDDTCDVRRRVLSSVTWAPVGDGDVAAGTYESPNLTPATLRTAALKRGFPAADVDEYLGSTYPGTETLRYTLEITDTAWIVYHSVDGTAAVAIWSGPYVVTDAATVVAGEPPCGPMTLDVRSDTDHELAVVMVKDECIENGRTPVGELVAATTIYESATFRYLGE